MATFVWQNARLFTDEYDFSGQFNTLQLDYNAEMLDATAMQVATIGTRIRAPGLWVADMVHGGFLDFADEAAGVSGIDDKITTDLGVRVTHDISMLPNPQGAAGVIADGDHVYFGQFVTGEWQWVGQVGDLAEFEWGAHGNEQLARGRISIDDATAVTAAVDGSGYQLGSAPFGGAIDVPAGDRIVAMVHVVADDFTDLDFVLESDDNGGFASATTIASSLNHTGLSSAYLQSDGSTPITDDYFRLRVSDFTGTSATVLGSVGVVRGR